MVDFIGGMDDARGNEREQKAERKTSLCEILIPTSSLSHEATNVDENYSLEKISFLGVAYIPEMRSSAEMRI